MKVRTFGVYGMGTVGVSGRLTVSTRRMNGLSIWRWAMLWCGFNGGQPIPVQLDFGYAGVSVEERNVNKLTVPKPYTSLTESQVIDQAPFGGTYRDGIYTSGESNFDGLFDGRQRFILNAPIFTPDAFLTMSLTPTNAAATPVGRNQYVIEGLVSVIDDVPEQVLACFHRWGLNI